MCRLKEHAYAELPSGENHASQAKSLRPNTRNSVFPKALLLETIIGYCLCNDLNLIVRTSVG